jgi:hypothetical protein
MLLSISCTTAVIDSVVGTGFKIVDRLLDNKPDSVTVEFPKAYLIVQKPAKWKIWESLPGYESHDLGAYRLIIERDDEITDYQIIVKPVEINNQTYYFNDFYWSFDLNNEKLPFKLNRKIKNIYGSEITINYKETEKYIKIEFKKLSETLKIKE